MAGVFETRSAKGACGGGAVGHSFAVQADGVGCAAWDGLDWARRLLMGGETPRGMQALFSTLGHARTVMVEEDWKRFCQDCREHPVRRLVHEDPISSRSFARPRGYAGDAVLLDLMYEAWRPEVLDASPLGQEIRQYIYELPSVISLRGRRDLLAERIDAVAEEIPGARVLSLACGHLREAQRSQAVRERRLGRLLAVDQDPRSVAVVAREQGPSGVEAVEGSVKALLKGTQRFEDLDFVYAAGLYDYLPQPVAVSLTRVLFSMLRPGGRLLLANYTDTPGDAGCKAYMEAFMDWWLLYREERDVEEWFAELPRKDVAWRRLFRDDVGCILYAELQRR